ncbi:MAG: hypothetical protein ACXVOH_11215 [Bacteroidia bacterium]
MLRNSRTYIFFLLFVFLLSGLSSFAQSDVSEKKGESKEKKKEEKKDEEATPPVLGEIFKPTIGLGVGNLSFFGDLYKKHFQAPGVSRYAAELNLSQPLNNCFQFNFYVMFGKLGADERVAKRNENFESTIRLGGAQLSYDFSNFFKKKEGIRPFISTGIEGFEFLTKTDLKDKYGNTYYYWSDGSIKNMAEGSAGSQNAVNLVRDYKYESDVRELNKDGFGKYQERSWAIPVGIGFTADIGERLKFRYGATMHFTFTNHIEYHSGETKVTHAPNDKFLMMSASIHYDLITGHKDKEFKDVEDGHFDGVDWLAIDNGDEDGDGVKDFDDNCHGTPAGVTVDAKGCPLDDDKDMIADYRDDELPTPNTMIANGRGVGITDPMAQNWYDLFYDTTGGLRFAKIVNLDSIEHLKHGPPKTEDKVFTVELARYKGGIPSDEMAYLLSIGDVKSFTSGDETIVYTAGEYKDVRVATKRKDEFVNEGLKSARVGYFKGEDYYSMTDAELRAETDKANSKFGGGDVASGSGELKGKVVYRVQLGAYRNKLSAKMFKNVGDVIEMKTEDGFYRYASGLHKTINDAAHHRAELILEGYNDAFITAYKNGKRIPLSEAGAEYEDKNYKEDLKDTHIASSAIDASLVSFSVQLGLFKSTDQVFEEKLKKLKDVTKQAAGKSMRYTAGNFKDYAEAVRYKNSIIADFPGVFVVGVFKGEVISAQEAAEILLK